MSPSGEAHGWPVKPFNRQHPVRGLLGDPRVGGGGGKSFHFGVDVSALDGTAVHAVKGGRISINGQNVTVSLEGGSVILTDAKGNKAKVVTTDIEASNGVIHVIDSVLLPA